MKNIYSFKLKYGLLAFAILLLTACGKEFLEEEVRTETSPTNFFNNDAEGELAVNGVYQLLHDNNLYRQRGLDDYYTHGADVVGPSRNVNGTIHNYLIAEGVADGNGPWTQLYRIVNNATEFLENIDGNEKIDTRDRYVGELLFLRALAYYHLTNLWGDVPYYRDVIPAIERSNLGRFDKDVIRTDMKTDLERAITLLPAELYSGSDSGRATKWAALALKAKFHLFDKEWQDCKDACDEILDFSPHQLVQDLDDLFAPRNEFNIESIWEVDFVSLQGGPLNTTRTDDYNPRIRDEPARRNNDTIIDGNTVTRVDYFQTEVLQADNEDMTGYGWSVPLPEIARRENWQTGDLRYDASIVTKYKGWELSFPYYKKNWNLDQAESLRGDHPENFIVFRLADIYLMAAEAENELNGPTNAYDYVNKVRERAFEPDQPWSGLTQDSFREAMYDERKFELCAEGHRRMDLIRWGILLDVVKTVEHRSFNNPAANIQAHHVLLPIPQQQLELNSNLLESDPTNNNYR
ncbi:RagB/SusD family nutrient uptake outer membrane protein [Algibacter sp. TI.3.09]|uniref:RagB/SusD family nutrient uptake outer membrane protein n=1 Tax=Algibacter sp. TI.3.09 TaxID=3121298 RepID=UPI00311FF407